MKEPALALHGVSKSYPGVRALREVSFDVQPGQVHALLGENGAGKSTLIRILSGVEQPDAGTLSLFGEPYRPATPSAAIAAGVSTLYQEQNLLPDRTVTDNVLLGAGSYRFGVFADRAADRRDTRAALDRVGAGRISPDAVVGELSVADRQMVDIARALLRNGRVLILDEPTAALSAREVDALFAVLSTLPAQGVAVILVSHRLEEIFRVCDAVTVLRDGRHVRSAPVSELTANTLVEAMVGDDVRSELPPRTVPSSPTSLIQCRGLSGPGFSGVDLTVESGEILALAGVTGSGKEQLGQVLYGALAPDGGTLEVEGRPVRLTPRKAIALGIVGVPADRVHEGVIGSLSVTRNLALPSLSRLSSFGFLSRRGERALAGRRVAELSIKVSDPRVLVAQLSGGNQQKVALGKWLERAPRVLVLLEPTQGIDIKVRYEFYRLVNALADEGAGIVLVSSDLPEVQALADRVAVLRAGRIVGMLSRSQLSADALVRLSFGAHAPGPESSAAP